MNNEGEFHNMSLTIKHLTTEDSGVYWCEECNQPVEPLWMDRYMTLILVSAGTAGIVLLLSLVILFTWVIPRLKAQHTTNEQTGLVYENVKMSMKM
ncbi:uncharacterized protein LOC105013129 isoform X3 [Esox lucius]|uniref:uncharacterized protein LOC105013129 isoform X3 n=1 Tax=Esox lucius TaxID=8010 RepID=UPI001476EB22|nr:uncharacterized protein LOC105013129 isoform X3 [Esox lucius]